MQFIALTDIARQYSILSNKDELRNLFGGKGLNLAILTHFGFRVPSAFVIPTKAFDKLMRGGLAEYPDAHPQEVLKKITFPQDFVDELKSAMACISAKSWAVRSSSTDEDSETHSFAGLQQSVIGIQSIEECLEAIRTVWMSFYARERLLYPTQNDLTTPAPSMAVIVQAFVDSEAAGVVFTNHPLEGPKSVLINVSKGQCANVVDGKAAESLCIEKKMNNCEVFSEHLSNVQIRGILNTAIQIENKFGHPQDIEFAFENGNLNILQTRDIAQIKRNEARTLYSNVNVGEALSGVATPMTWSVGMHIARKGFETVFASFGLKVPDDYDFVTTFNGHIYLNISQFLSVAGQVPFLDRSLLGKIVGIHALDEYAFSVEQIGKSHFIRNLPGAVRELFRIQSRISKLPQKAAAFELNRDKLLAIDLKNASKSEIQKSFEQLDDVFCACAFDMLSAGGAFLASYIVCSSFIDHFDENESNELEQYLFSGLLDVQSAAPGLALLDMASAIHAHAELAEAFTNESKFDNIEDFENKIRALDGFDEFNILLQRFMALYGARAVQEAEIANPRWREDPRFLYKVIRAHLKSGIRSDTLNITASAASDREKHTNEFRNMLSRTMRPIFKSLLGMTQKNARLREVWRSYVVDVLGIFRKFFLEVAFQWVEAGILGRQDDIFFLTYEEFLAGIQDVKTLENARLSVAFRRARHEACLSACALPDTFVTHPNQCCESDAVVSTKILYGIPASPGCVKAKVRVAHTLEEAADLEYGEILVASSTDVGWTPLFLVASAILTERGGPLSHAFVVAREYGIPAVVSVPGLLSSLKTGDIVRVSGLDGTVEF